MSFSYTQMCTIEYAYGLGFFLLSIVIPPLLFFYSTQLNVNWLVFGELINRYATIFTMK